MARVKYYDSTTQTWKYADMALQTGIHVGTTAPTNEAMLWVDTASNQIDSFPLTDVQDSDGNSLIVDQIAVIPSMPSGTNNGDILVWDGDEWVSKPKWQMIYQPVEYIESTGTQKIRTGVFAGPTTRLVADMQFTKTPTAAGDSMLNGATNATWAFVWGWDKVSNEFKTIVNSSYQWNSATQGDTNRHIWDLSNGSQKIDNVEYSTSSMMSVSTLYDITFGARYSMGNFNTPSNAKYYSVKIYDGSTLIRDFLPVYNIYTGEAGCYETVEQKFYGNVGSGSFTHGADVN